MNLVSLWETLALTTLVLLALRCVYRRRLLVWGAAASFGLSVAVGMTARSHFAKQISIGMINPAPSQSPLNEFAFLPQEIPTGYELAAYDHLLSEVLTGNPGYLRESLNNHGEMPMVEAIYRKGANTLMLHTVFFPDPEAVKAFAEDIRQTEKKQNELPIAMLWSKQAFVLLSYTHLAQLSAEEINEVWAAAKKLQIRLYLPSHHYFPETDYPNTQDASHIAY